MEDLVARGRGAGLGAVLVAQGLAGLNAAWGEKRVKELMELVNTWICLRSGADTADVFSRHVGVVEGVQTSASTSTAVRRSDTRGTTAGGGHTRSPGGASWNASWGESASVTTGTTHTTGESFALHTKPAVLPSEVTGLPLADPRADVLRGFAVGPDVGAFEFATPFMTALDHYPPAPFAAMPTRPESDQLLRPWTLSDLTRLKLDVTPEFHQALRTTWGSLGGL